MKRPIFGTMMMLFVWSATAVAAGNGTQLRTQIDAARVAIDVTAAKVEGSKEALADLTQARNGVAAAEECLKAGKSMFGFGDVGPDSVKEVKQAMELVEIYTISALSRVEFTRATGELEAIEKQYAAVSAKLKLFDDRKAELARLRQEAVASQATAKENELLKGEKTALTAQVEQLTSELKKAEKLKAEQSELARKLEELKGENSRLNGQLDKARGATTPPNQSQPVKN